MITCYQAHPLTTFQTESNDFGHLVCTLPPIIMEVENGVLEDVWLVSKWAIFHFHAFGRKGIPFRGLPKFTQKMLTPQKSDIDTQNGIFF